MVVLPGGALTAWACDNDGAGRGGAGMLKSNLNCLFKYSKTILGVIAARRSLDRSERDFRQWMLICHISAGRGVVGVGV